MANRRYFSILEANEWEGETWFFFIPYEKSTLSTKTLDDLNTYLDDTNFCAPYIDYCLTQEEVNILLKRAGLTTSYMNDFNLLDDQVVNDEIIRAFMKKYTSDEIGEMWYKGNIFFK
jgi:hypothetical protein